MKETRKAVGIAVGIFLLGVLSLLGLKVIDALKDTNRALNEALPSVYYLSTDDSSLVSPTFLEQMRVVDVKRTTYRSNFSKLSFDDFILIVHRLETVSLGSFKSCLHKEVTKTDRSTGVAYAFVPVADYVYGYRASTPEPIKDIYLAMSGKMIKTVVVSDSVAAYSLFNDNLSIRYGLQMPIDIHVTKGSSIVDKPILTQIMFLKRNNSLYFIVLTPKNGKTVKDDLILDVII